MRIQTIKLLVSLKNASELKKEYVLIKYNITFEKILSFFYSEGLILSYQREFYSNSFKIFLKNSQGNNFFKNLKILSSPSKQLFLRFKDIVLLNEKKQIFIFFTTKGLYSSIICKKLKVGGTLLFSC